MSELQQITRSAKREYWRKHIENWLAGNLSQRKYCEQENISLASFSWWKTKGLKDKPKTNKISFVQAVIKKPESTSMQSHNEIQLIFPNHAKLVLPSNLPIDHLVTIVSSLERLL